LSSLKDKDTEFYEYLKENDPKLLEFDMMGEEREDGSNSSEDEDVLPEPVPPSVSSYASKSYDPEDDSSDAIASTDDEEGGVSEGVSMEGDGESIDKTDDDDEEEDVTPVPSNSKWMDTEMKELNIKEGYELNISTDETRAKAKFDATVDQSLSPEWYKECAKHITASAAKDIICHQSSTDPSRLLSRLTSTKVLQTELIEYWRMHEKDALAMYSKVMLCVGKSHEISPSGFIISVEETWLGATPDAIVGSGIVEVKCPFVCRDRSFEVAAATKPTFCLKKSGNGLHLSDKYRYYHQVQVQLFVSKATYCDFVV
jgi:hypothetical protein